MKGTKASLEIDGWRFYQIAGLDREGLVAIAVRPTNYHVSEYCWVKSEVLDSNFIFTLWAINYIEQQRNKINETNITT